MGFGIMTRWEGVFFFLSSFLVGLGSDEIGFAMN